MRELSCRPCRLVLGCLAVVLVAGGALLLAGCSRQKKVDEPVARTKAVEVRPAGPLGPEDASDPAARLCLQFRDLKNAKDPQADGLLGPAPQVPESALAPAEADRLDAEIMLHQPLHVREVRRDSTTPADHGRFVLVVDGSVASERVIVQTPAGTETRQRAMYSPDLVVEVHDGKIHGVLPRLHED